MTRRDQMLDALAIGPQWLRREVAPAPPSDNPNLSLLPDTDVALVAARRSDLDNRQDSTVGGVGRHTDTEIAGMDWAALQAAVSTCTRCDLCRSRTRTVFGAGDAKAKWLFVGEGPGRNEDQQGEPFVGPAGKLLDNMLAAVGMSRERDVYVTALVKCRPANAKGGDRAPTAEEVAACRPFLERERELSGAGLVLTLGQVAASGLLGKPLSEPLAGARGTVHRLGDVPLVATLHPGELLRRGADKALAWADLCRARAAADGRAG